MPLPQRRKESREATGDKDQEGAEQHRGYQGGRVQSYTYSVEETDQEKLDLFGSLVSDLAFEVQDSTITRQYVSQDSKDYSAIEYFIECDTQNKHDMADIIEKYCCPIKTEMRGKAYLTCLFPGVVF